MVAPFAVCKNPENQILAHDENLRTTYSAITFVSTTYGFFMKRILLENAFEISSEKCLLYHYLFFKCNVIIINTYAQVFFNLKKILKYTSIVATNQLFT